MFRRTLNNNASNNDGESLMNDTTETVDIDTKTQNQTTGEKRNLEVPQGARRPGMPGFGQPGGLMGGFGQPGNPNVGGLGHNSQLDPNAKKLTISEGISISGEIKDCDQLVVEGSVKADFSGSEHMEISETGEFKGSVETVDADIAGFFDGTLVVNGRLTVRSTGKIKGTITYDELAVEAGAVIEGKILPKSASETSSSTSTKGKTTAKKSKEEENVAQMQLATGS